MQLSLFHRQSTKAGIHRTMKVNELILGSIDGPCVYRQGTFLSSSSSSSRRTSLSYFSIHPVPPSSSSFLLLTHLHKISQGTDSLTPGLLAPLSSSPGASTQPRGISPKLAFVQAREHEISRWTGARTMNFALIIGCVAVTATAFNGKCRKEERSNLLSFGENCNPTRAQ